MDQIFKRDVKEQFGKAAIQRENIAKMIMDSILGGKHVVIGMEQNVFLKAAYIRINFYFYML